jgi:surfactin synthase thioesterase subunit
VGAMVAAIGEPAAVLGHSGGARIALDVASHTDQAR